MVIIPTTGWIPLFCAAFIFQLEFWANITYTKNISSMIYLYVVVSLAYVISCISYYYLWTNILGFYAPMPFTGYLCGTAAVFVLYVAAWFRYTGILSY